MKQNNALEVERKYILLEKSYERLLETLKQNKLRWRLLKQQNFYFSDKEMIIFQKKGLLRIRVEEIVAESESDQPSPPRRVLLTLKGPKIQNATVGAITREEKEYILDHQIPNDHFTDIFKHLDASHLEDIWDWYSKDFQGIYKDSNNVSYKLLTQTINERYTFKMHNGFIFELDKTHFSKKDIDYELEVELNPNKDEAHLLDEYIEDKFKALKIPIENPEWYPPKVVRAYIYASLIDGELLERIKAFKKQIELKTFT